ncbi:MAG: DUF7151 family protein, partial [Myxococcota bacterium]
MKQRSLLVGVLIWAFSMTGCGGEAGESSMVRLEAEPAGDNCPEGGHAIHYGLDANGDGVLSDDEVTATEYVCNGPEGQSALVSTEDEPPGENCPNGGVAVHSGVDLDGDGVLDPEEVTETSYLCAGDESGDDVPPVDEEDVECVSNDECPDGFACVDWACVLDCAGDTDCPEGYFCSPVTGRCNEKLCETDADCTEAEQPQCHPEWYECVAPAPARAPVIENFRASPPAVVVGSETPVTWVWDETNSPVPEPTCTIDQGVGEVTPGAVAAVTASNQLPATYTLTCTNSEGSSSASVTLPAVSSTPVTLEIPPEGGTFEFGPVTLEVPPGALQETTPITARPSDVFVPSPDLATLPVELYPHGLHFLNPVRVTVPVDTSILPAAGWNVSLSDLHVGHTEDGQWGVRLFTDVDVAEGTLSATIGHFSSVAASSSDEGSCTRTPLSAPRKSLVKREEFIRFGDVAWGAYDVFGQVHDDLKQSERDRMADILEPLGQERPDG